MHEQLIFSLPLQHVHLFIYDHCIDPAKMEINEQKRLEIYIGNLYVCHSVFETHVLACVYWRDALSSQQLQIHKSLAYSIAEKHIKIARKDRIIYFIARIYRLSIHSLSPCVASGVITLHDFNELFKIFFGSHFSSSMSSDFYHKSSHRTKYL